MSERSGGIVLLGASGLPVRRLGGGISVRSEGVMFQRASRVPQPSISEVAA
jgi:hypothetical protein